MVNIAEFTQLKVGDRVKLTRGWLRGRTATISGVNKDGSYFLIGDWTQETGFILVNYGPVEPDQIEAL